MLKPGGHLLAFAGTRTQDWMAMSLRFAGFEIRDMIAWVYGSGFPKSMDISKRLDLIAGAKREVLGPKVYAGGHIQNHSGDGEQPYSGGYSQCKTGGTTAETAPATEAAKQWEGWGTAIKPALEPITLARKPPIGTVAANVLEHGTGGLNIGACRVTASGPSPSVDRRKGKPLPPPSGIWPTAQDRSKWSEPHPGEDLGRFPANFIHDGSEQVLALFPEVTCGTTKSHHHQGGKPRGIYGAMDGIETDRGYGDSGSAARFFYCAKASRDDRDEGCGAFELTEAEVKNDSGRGFSESDPMAAVMRRNPHPTVKPTDLMRYLCRLITPPNGIVLDPFTGSGSTGKAAMAEGFRFIGIEREAEYIEIARARISAEAEKPRQLSLF